MKKKSRVGTFDDPIWVLPDSCERPSLWLYLKKGFFAKKTQDSEDKDNDEEPSNTSEPIGRRAKKKAEVKNRGANLNHWASADRDYYIKNVLHNQQLTLAETKIALYLYDLMAAEFVDPEFRGLVCIVRATSTGIDLERRYGDIDGIYIMDKYHGKETYQYFDEKYSNLYDVCQSLIPNASTKVISEALANLHNFGYLTVTDIIEENQRSYRLKSGENYIEDEYKPSRRPRLKHVRLCRWMIHTKIWDKFIWS